MIEAFTLVAPREDVASGHEERVPLFVRKPHPPQREIPNARGTKHHLSSHHVSRQTRRNEHSAHFCAKRDRFPRRSILARASFPAISHFSRLKISPWGGPLSLYIYKARALRIRPSPTHTRPRNPSPPWVIARKKEKRKRRCCFKNKRAGYARVPGTAWFNISVCVVWFVTRKMFLLPGPFFSGSERL